MSAEHRAAEHYRVESQPTTLPFGRKVRTFLANLVAGGYGGASFNWPPVDVVLIEGGTGAVARRWHEYGNGAAELERTLADDLEGMELDDFAAKWEVPPRR